MDASGPGIEFYLEHSHFVRRLARSLVYDEGEAADLEQETWLTALCNPPCAIRPGEGGSPRAWLGTVVANLAWKGRRSAARRRRRESLAAREREAVPTPEQLWEQEQVRRRVIEAVLALEEPYRSVIVLRYLDGLSPSEVGERMGTPCATVRTRTRRALQRLRTALARGEEGRGTWALTLIRAFDLAPERAAVPPAAPFLLTLKGAFLMGGASKVLFAAICAVFLIVGLGRFGVSHPVGPGEPPRGPVRQGTDLTRGETPWRKGPLTESAGSVLRREPAPGPATPAQEEGGALSLSVRWFDGTPAPAVNLRCTLRDGAGGSDRILLRRSDAEGRCRLDHLPPGRVIVEPDRGGYGQAWVEVGEESRLELVLPRGADVEGRVVDELGRGVEGAAILFWRPFRPAYELDLVARSDGEGRFTLRSVDVSRSALLCARAEGYAPSRRIQIAADEGSRVPVLLLLHEGAGALEGQVEDDHGQPVGGAQVLLGPADAFAPRTEPDGSRSLAPVGQLVRTDGHGRFRVSGAPLGRLILHARAEGFAAAAVEVDTRAASFARITLGRGGEVGGRVVDGEGRPLEGVVIETTPRFTFAGRRTQSAADGSYCLRNLAPGEAHLAADGGTRGRVETTCRVVEGLHLDWEVTLDRRSAIRGRVVVETGSPADWHVVATAARDGSRRFTRTDGQGRFEFPPCPDGEYSVAASPPGSVLVEVCRQEQVRPGRQELLLYPDPKRLPSVRLSGRVLDGEGGVVGDARIWVRGEGVLYLEPEGVDPADGRFEVGPLPPGSWSLVIEARGRAPLELGPRELGPGEEWRLGELVLGEAGSLRVTLEGRMTLVGEGELTSRVQGIEVVTLEGRRVAWVEADGEEVRTPPLEPGTYRIALHGEGVALESVSAVVRAGEETWVPLPLRRGTPVSWSYRRADGVPLGEAPTVRLEDAAGHTLAHPSVTGEPPEFTSRMALAPGRYRVLAEAAGGAGELELVVGAQVPFRGELILRTQEH